MILVKRFKNYLASLKALEVKEKQIDKELKNEAKEEVILKTFILFLPVYLILINLMFIFAGSFYLLVFILNVIVFLNIYYYQYSYYKYLELNRHKLTIIKALIYGLILTIFLWLIAYVVGRFLWNIKKK